VGRPEADGVVAGHAAGIAAAEAIGELARRAAPRRVDVGRGGRSGGCEGLDPAELEVSDEALLQGLPEAFDATLGLRRVGAM
jgi:hypothetical protein